MNIRVYYEDGRVTSYSTSGQTTSDPFKAEAPRGSGNILTEYNVRLDRLMEEGLFLDINWYNLLQDGAPKAEDNLWSRPLSVAFHEPGRRVMLASSKMMSKMAKIIIDNEVVAWKEIDTETGEGSIINGIQFSMIDWIYNNADSSVKEKAFILFNILSTLHPEKDKESICGMFGYTTSLLDDAIATVEAQQGIKRVLGSGLHMNEDGPSVPVLPADAMAVSAPGWEGDDEDDEDFERLVGEVFGLEEDGALATEASVSLVPGMAAGSVGVKDAEAIEAAQKQGLAVMAVGAREATDVLNAQGGRNAYSVGR